jgi:HAD superfamily hydrolase (TIGR01509 family)
MKKAAIFDLDGTLVDSMWVWADIDINYLEQFGYEPPADLKAVIEGMSMRETAEYFKGRFKIEDTVEEIQDAWNLMAYDRYNSKVKLKPLVFDLLRILRSEGMALGIATSNSRILTEAVLASNGILNLFETILTGEDVKNGKPDPEIYLTAADKLDVSPGDCLVFEDVLMGVMAGKNAGMSVCAVYDQWNEPQKQDIMRLADHYINGYEEIATWQRLQGLLGG